MIFSIGYGQDENGQLTMDFGPLNRPGGWRGLNVAVTRARYRTEVVSSIRAGDIPESVTGEGRAAAAPLPRLCRPWAARGRARRPRRR